MVTCEVIFKSFWQVCFCFFLKIFGFNQNYLLNYQIEHLLVGFILLPTGQLKSLANSSLFESAPITRISPGDRPFFKISSFKASSVYFAQWTWLKLIQNSCLGVYGSPISDKFTLKQFSHKLLTKKERLKFILQFPKFALLFSIVLLF